MERKVEKTAVTSEAASGVGQKRTLVGEVVSTKMEKTIIVKIKRRVMHPVYKKFITRARKFMAHDETGVASDGDLVEIIESRPLSKNKRWALKKVVRKGLDQTILDLDGAKV